MKYKTEQEYVNHIINTEKHRKKVITFFVVLSVALLIPITYYTLVIYNQAQILLSNLESKNMDIAQSAFQKSIEISNFYIGLGIGCVISAGYFTAITTLVKAIEHYIAGRKDRMLIKYYEKSKQYNA